MAPTCWNIRGFWNKCSAFRRVLATLLRRFGAPSDLETGALFSHLPVLLLPWPIAKTFPRQFCVINNSQQHLNSAHYRLVTYASWYQLSQFTHFRNQEILTFDHGYKNQGCQVLRDQKHQHLIQNTQSKYLQMFETTEYRLWEENPVPFYSFLLFWSAKSVFHSYATIPKNIFDKIQSVQSHAANSHNIRHSVLTWTKPNR